ncbi:hypothetical protein NPIL_79301 [Nephila pilipes]|uniref:Uncharacterized protein n=1 Tax=Nephila pilipes TaxID=299642 RepID=A0A8X6NZZ5_NEPPI|nr:hypothetical protein NPIL_79301 [Nephila pilipes]
MENDIRPTRSCDLSHGGLAIEVEDVPNPPDLGQRYSKPPDLVTYSWGLAAWRCGDNSSTPDLVTSREDLAGGVEAIPKPIRSCDLSRDLPEVFKNPTRSWLTRELAARGEYSNPRIL